MWSSARGSSRTPPSSASGFSFAAWPGDSSRPPPGGCWASPCETRSAASKCSCASAARKLFSEMREERYLFDLELLMLARQFQLTVVEVPIRWHEVRGGQMRPLCQS